MALPRSANRGLNTGIPVMAPSHSAECGLHTQGRVVPAFADVLGYAFHYKANAGMPKMMRAGPDCQDDVHADRIIGDVARHGRLACRRWSAR